MLCAVRRSDKEKTERVTRDEAFKQRLVHAGEVLANFLQCVLRGRAKLHGRIIGGPVEIEKDRRLLALCKHAGEIHRERGCADSTLHAEKCVDLAELAASGSNTPRSLFEARHAIAKFDALQRLNHEIVRA